MLDSANALIKMPWACSSWKIPGSVQLDNCVFLHFPAVFLGCQFGHITPLLLRLWQVSNGCQMKPSATALAPNIEVADHNADNANLFTLVRLLDFLFDSLLLKRSCCYGQLIQSVDARCIYISQSIHVELIWLLDVLILCKLDARRRSPVRICVKTALL
jgi:hypothetical protein